MSDLFHKKVPRSYIDQVFETMEAAHWHTFQILTKRTSLMRRYVNARYKEHVCPEHIWLGVSIEDGTKKSRVEHLRQTNAIVRFLSVEPLIGRIGELDLSGIHWVIVGGESGPKARPMKISWVREVRNQCVREEVAFFFKQWGGFRPKSGGRELDGEEWSQYPQSSGAERTAAIAG